MNIVARLFLSSPLPSREPQTFSHSFPPHYSSQLFKLAFPKAEPFHYHSFLCGARGIWGLANPLDFFAFVRSGRFPRAPLPAPFQPDPGPRLQRPRPQKPQSQSRASVLLTAVLDATVFPNVTSIIATALLAAGPPPKPGWGRLFLCRGCYRRGSQAACKTLEKPLTVQLPALVNAKNTCEGSLRGRPHPCPSNETSSINCLLTRR